MPEEESSTRAIEALGDYASEHGLGRMLDLIASIYQTYAPMSHDLAVRTVCELTGLSSGMVGRRLQ